MLFKDFAFFISFGILFHNCELFFISNTISSVNICFYIVENKRSKVLYNKVLEFSAAVREYHYYWRYWIPQEDQKNVSTILLIDLQ